MTEDVDVSSGIPPWASGVALESNHLLQWFAAATGLLTATVPNDANIDVGNAFSIALRPSNAAPALDATRSPTLGTVSEDPGAASGAGGVLVSSLVDFASPSGQVDNVTDPDAGAQLGVAITAVDAQASAYYSLNGGSTWAPMGSLNNANALLLAADADNRIYVQPAANLNGTLSTALTFRAWDQAAGLDGDIGDASTNGGSTPFSTATDGISLTVTAVKEPPHPTHPSAAQNS